MKDKIFEAYACGFSEKVQYIPSLYSAYSEEKQKNLNLHRIQLFKYELLHIIEKGTNLILTSNAKFRIFQGTSIDQQSRLMFRGQPCHHEG